MNGYTLSRAQVNKTLLWLGLGSNTIGAEGAWALAESLRTNKSLLWLGLGGNELGDRGALHLAGLLQGACVSVRFTQASSELLISQATPAACNP